MTNEPNRQLDDTDREEILRLVLSEAAGTDVSEKLATYPVKARSTFRKAAFEAGLVRSSGLDREGEEILFGKSAQLSERGKHRLAELNTRAAQKED